MSKAQLVKCKCGQIIAACLEPECYLDREWKKDLTNYVKRGYIIDLRETGDWQFGKCICKDEKQITLDLFKEEE